VSNTIAPSSPARRRRRRSANGRAARPWGDTLQETTTEGGFRLAFLNPDGLPVPMNGAKYQELSEFIDRHSIDALGISEHNLNITHLPSFQSWAERRRKFPPHYAMITSNQHTAARQPFLPGGTAVMAFHSLLPRAYQRGDDPSGLGRWSWLRIRGKDMQCRIVQGYRPNIPNVNSKHSTVYAQHEAYFRCKGDGRDPRDAFIQDLGVEIKKWQNDFFFFSL
jgi:hypothetical protein